MGKKNAPQWQSIRMNNTTLIIATIDPFVSGFLSHYTLMFSYHPGTEECHKMTMVFLDTENPSLFWDGLRSLSKYLAKQGMVFVPNELKGSPNQITLYSHLMMSEQHSIDWKMIFNRLKTEFMFHIDTYVESTERRNQLVESYIGKINDANDLNKAMAEIDEIIDTEFPSLAEYRRFLERARNGNL